VTLIKTSTRRALLAVVALTGALAMAGTAGAATVQISTQEFSFVPQTPTAVAGDTVRWTNNGTVTHNVTVEGQGPMGTDLSLGDFSPGGQVSRVFAAPGTFRFYCRFHGDRGGVGMSGTLTVQDAGTTSTSTSTSTTVAPTSTSTSTSTSLPATTTTLNSSQCAQLRAARASFNAQADANAAAIRAAGLTPSQQAAALAQLEAARARGNSQIDTLLAASNCR